MNLRILKYWVRFCISVALIAAASPAAVKPKAHTAKRPVAKASAQKHANRKKSSRKHTVAGRQPVRQAAPSSDRYKEIQEALAQKGYLTTPPNGVWDQNAQDAMRKFQADQNLSVSGKLSSRSLIALGFGSPTAAVPPSVATPSTVPPKP